MANYHYDEAGAMASYFVITILAIILVPLTLSTLTSPASNREDLDGCQCQPCIDMRHRVKQREWGSLLKSKLSRRSILLLFGWSLVAYLTHKAVNTIVDTKVYNPFEILGLSTGVTEKEIKSHFKKLSRIYHPDKVKATINETAEDIAARFVEITKAYKSLTDETIRQNWELYGHPDGRQEVSMGIALPKWIIEGKNNIWVLGLYGLIFGGALPALVGRWWFGSREKTKDGIHTLTAANFFKSLTEESGIKDVVSTFGRAYQWENTSAAAIPLREVDRLDTLISEKLGDEWTRIKMSVGKDGKLNEKERKALVILYAHFLHLTLPSPTMERARAELLLQTPTLLNALINIAAARNWLLPTLSAMRLHANMVQASLPGKTDLEGDVQAQKVVENKTRLDVVDASFKVIGERLVTPASFVYLVVKLRLRPLSSSESATAEKISADAERDELFLNSKLETEELKGDKGGYAHAPFWPGYRKAGWWIVLGDDKSNRIAVPPMKITDVPLSKPGEEGLYRSYKLQFQAPQTVGLFTWKLYFVSDTFINEDICRDISLKIDDVSALTTDEQGAEDDISDPEEDSLAGQMAAMRGGSVKKSPVREESDDESSTDDDDRGNDSSDSDSD